MTDLTQLPSPGQKRLLFVMLGSPYVDETITTMFRLMNSALSAGHQVIVWCCGGSTRLTCVELGNEKPRNFADLGKQEASPHCPTTSMIVSGLARAHPGRITWHVCRHCAEEHGAAQHVVPARLRPSTFFAKVFNDAEIRVIVGTK